jgi:hypothetical protein
MMGKRVIRWASILGLVDAGVLLVSLSSCAHNQQLVSITVSPPSFTFFAPLGPGVPPNVIPLTAYGAYIHPPETKNITSQVIWSSDQTLVADVSSSGDLTAGVACGVANVSASVYTDRGNPNGPVVVGTMTVTVDGPASQGCPQGTATNSLSVDVTAGAADGLIVSSPAGINCGSTCSASFPAGSSVVLTATPNSGKSFLGWAAGCSSVSGTTCTVTLSSDVIVSASFN